MEELEAFFAHPPVGPEEWLPHPTLPDINVSDYGRLQRGDGEPWPGTIRRGRYYLTYGGKNYCVARLVLETFHNQYDYKEYRWDATVRGGDMDGKGTADWDDEDKTNNRFQNLLWAKTGPGWTREQLVEARNGILQGITDCEKSGEIDAEAAAYIRKLLEKSPV